MLYQALMAAKLAKVLRQRRGEKTVETAKLTKLFSDPAFCLWYDENPQFHCKLNDSVRAQIGT